jgi:hypothetical protein
MAATNHNNNSEKSNSVLLKRNKEYDDVYQLLNKE